MTFPAPVPEIPAANIAKAAAYYVNSLGFTLDWGEDGQGGIAGISRGNCRLFITDHSFREPRLRDRLFLPVVPHGKARIRTQMSAAHTRPGLEFAIAKFAEAKQELGI